MTDNSSKSSASDSAADLASLVDRLRARLGATDDPLLAEMLEERIAELTGRSPYCTVRDELDRALCDVRAAEGWGTKEYARRWSSLKRRILTTHRWTEQEFYAELDRRWKQRTTR